MKTRGRELNCSQEHENKKRGLNYSESYEKRETHTKKKKKRSEH